jgi:hypothetical protein
MYYYSSCPLIQRYADGQISFREGDDAMRTGVDVTRECNQKGIVKFGYSNMLLKLF